MGFGNVATTIILFIAVLLLATGVITTINTNVERSQASMKIQNDYLNNQIKTNILINQVDYNAGVLTVYVINNGKTILKPELTDIYLDAAFIPRNETGRTITIEPSTDTTNPGLWDPHEIIRIDANIPLTPGQHRVTITTQYGVSDEQLFSI
jgi:archaellum component FlaF (FlaF/FlaG flagellin family)